LSLQKNKVEQSARREEQSRERRKEGLEAHTGMYVKRK
jgi:hypothetical protein